MQHLVPKRVNKIYFNSIQKLLFSYNVNFFDSSNSFEYANFSRSFKFSLNFKHIKSIFALKKSSFFIYYNLFSNKSNLLKLISKIIFSIKMQNLKNRNQNIKLIFS